MWNWSYWHINGHFLDKFVFVWVYFKIPWWYIPSPTKPKVELSPPEKLYIWIKAHKIKGCPSPTSLFFRIFGQKYNELTILFTSLIKVPSKTWAGVEEKLNMKYGNSSYIIIHHYFGQNNLSSYVFVRLGNAERLPFPCNGNWNMRVSCTSSWYDIGFKTGKEINQCVRKYLRQWGQWRTTPFLLGHNFLSTKVMSIKLCFWMELNIFFVLHNWRGRRNKVLTLTLLVLR